MQGRPSASYPHPSRLRRASLPPLSRCARHLPLTGGVGLPPLGGRLQTLAVEGLWSSIDRRSEKPSPPGGGRWLAGGQTDEGGEGRSPQSSSGLRPRGSAEKFFGFFHPHPSRLRRATFPREGEGFRHWHSLDCGVVSIGAAKSLPPWRGKVAPPQAVTDEGGEGEAVRKSKSVPLIRYALNL